MTLELKMTLKEADRLVIVRRLEIKDLNITSAARELRVSSRQMKRIWKRYRQMGPMGIISLRKGKPNCRRLSIELREKTLNLIREKYSDYGPTLVAEKLKEKHGIDLSKEMIRRLMIADNLRGVKKTKRYKVHPRRTRRSRVGELVQIDGSYEYWFEERGEKCCLIVFVDDATSQIALMRFCRTETSEDYLKMLRMYLERYGRPLALYSDKHSIFRVTKKEQYTEGKWTTRFHGVLKELDIELICAHSPQAKGRVERANGTLQDRLIKEMRERRISSIEEGNAFLDEFTKIYNKKFAKAPANPEDAHRSLLPSHKPEQLFMLKETRILSKDLSFQYKNEIYQIEAERRHSLRGEVDIFESEGKVIMILKEGRSLKYRKWKERQTETVPVIDAKELEIYWPEKKKRKQWRNHPWK
ncbi:MAG TPA: ISNCY family transposase [Chlamydiales bacterium]|nr:ISNCY family transposase [Chlamydiales bacterium]